MNACRGAVADHLSAFRLCLSSLVGLDPSRLWRVSQGPAKHRIPSRDVFDPILPCVHAHVGGHRLCRNLARAEPRRRRSVARDRSRERQGSFCPECRVSLVSRLRHQADDGLCDAACGQGGASQPRHAACGFLERGGAVAGEDGVRRWHHRDRGQCTQDVDGEIGERHGGRTRRRRRRLDRELCR